MGVDKKMQRFSWKALHELSESGAALFVDSLYCSLLLKVCP